MEHQCPGSRHGHHLELGLLHQLQGLGEPMGPIILSGSWGLVSLPGALVSLLGKMSGCTSSLLLQGNPLLSRLKPELGTSPLLQQVVSGIISHSGPQGASVDGVLATDRSLSVGTVLWDDLCTGCSVSWQWHLWPQIS